MKVEERWNEFYMYYASRRQIQDVEHTKTYVKEIGIE